VVVDVSEGVLDTPPGETNPNLTPAAHFLHQPEMAALLALLHVFMLGIWLGKQVGKTSKIICGQRVMLSEQTCFKMKVGGRRVVGDVSSFYYTLL